MDWRAVYKWEIIVGGKKISQFPADLSMEKIVKRYGKVDTLSLVPQKAGFHRFDIPIPKGAVPVYKRDVNVSNTPGQSYLEFMVGWAAGGISMLNIINAKTGDIEMRITK